MELPFDVPDGVTLETDVTPAAWIDERLLPINRRVGVQVGEVIPTGFEAYARIFHPVRVPGGGTIRWSEIAERNGRVEHPEMQLEHLVGTLDLDQLDGMDPPLEGCLPVEDVVALVDTLGPFAATPDVCWFCVWDGFGFYGGSVSLSWSPGEDPRAIRARERLERERAHRARAQLDAIPVVNVHPSPDGRGAFRSYYLFRGSIAAASRLEFNGQYQSPNLWWPDDRGWCVATEIDGYSTYVGGSGRCIEAVLGDQRLEALPSSVHNRFDLWSDRINPSPPGLPDHWGGA